MKFKLILFLLMLSSVRGIAQLSIDGTIIYIDEKINECADLRNMYNNPLYYRMTDLKLAHNSSDQTKLIFEITKMYSTGAKSEIQYIFDPSQIESIAHETNSFDAMHFLLVQMIGPTVLVKTEQNGSLQETNARSFRVPFLKFDPLNVERMRKAFLNLKKLYANKKGSDPFAN